MQVFQNYLEKRLAEAEKSSYVCKMDMVGYYGAIETTIREIKEKYEQLLKDQM